MVGRLSTRTWLLWYDAYKGKACGIWTDAEEPHEKDELTYKDRTKTFENIQKVKIW